MKSRKKIFLIDFNKNVLDYFEGIIKSEYLDVEHISSINSIDNKELHFGNLCAFVYLDDLGNKISCDKLKSLVDDSGLPIIAVVPRGNVETAVKAIKCGAFNAIDTAIRPDEFEVVISLAFQQLSEYRSWHDHHINLENRISLLTERERQVLNGLACGMPNKTIAYDLGISIRTVEVHRSNIMLKLCARNFAQALKIAFEAGFGVEYNPGSNNKDKNNNPQLSIKF